MKASLLLLFVCFFQYSLSSSTNVVEIIGKIDESLLFCQPDILGNYYYEFKIPISIEQLDETQSFTMRLKNPNYIDAECTIYVTSSNQLKSDDSNYIDCKVDAVKFPIIYAKEGYVELPNKFSTETITFDNWEKYFGSNSKIEIKKDCFQSYTYEFNPSGDYESEYDKEEDITGFGVYGTLKKNNEAITLREDDFISFHINFLLDRDYYEDDCVITKDGGKYAMGCMIEGVHKQIQFYYTTCFTGDYYVLIDISRVYELKGTMFSYSKLSGLLLVLLYLLL